jgi:hypothetical protein
MIGANWSAAALVGCEASAKPDAGKVVQKAL